MKSVYWKKERNKLAFCLSLLIIPLLAYCVFYIGVNINSIKLAFVKYEGTTMKFVWFDNFAAVFAEMFSGGGNWDVMFRNSFLVFVITFFKTPLTWIVAYFIYKRNSNWTHFLKVILFIPTMFSMMVTVLVYKYFVSETIPALFGVSDLLGNPNTQFIVLCLFTYWNGFGTGMIVYLNAMSAIPQSTVEAAELDGVTFMQEFVHITLPMIFPTFKSLFIVSVTSIFVSQFNLFEFFGETAYVHLHTIGYYLFMKTKLASNDQYPYWAAMGLVITCISLPITFGTRWLMNKIDPMEGK